MQMLGRLRDQHRLLQIKTRPLQEGVMKKCSRCASLKPFEAFYRQAASRDGRAPACKECTKKYAKERYWRDPGRYRAESKSYRDAHPEKRREWQRAYNARHREEINARFAAMGWRKRWAALHPERRRAIEAKRRAQRHLTQIERVDYESIYERDGGICYLCNGVVTTKDMEFDHVVPLSRGGAHTEVNIALAHAMCNRRKGVKSADAVLILTTLASEKVQ